MFARTEKLCTEYNLLFKQEIDFSYANFNNVQSEKSKFGPMVLRNKQKPLMIKFMKCIQDHSCR